MMMGFVRTLSRREELSTPSRFSRVCTTYSGGTSEVPSRLIYSKDEVLP